MWLGKKNSVIAMTIWKKKNQVGGITLADGKTYYITRVIKTVKNGHLSQWNRKREPRDRPKQI